MSSVAAVANKCTVIVQMVAFSDPSSQLPRYLETMEEAGLQEMFLPALKGKADGRLWRSVPSRRWYSDQRGETPGSQEVPKAMLYWNTLMFELGENRRRQAEPRCASPSWSTSSWARARKEKGYRFIPEAGLSVQDQDANQAWRASVHLLKLLHISMHVVMGRPTTRQRIRAKRVR